MENRNPLVFANFNFRSIVSGSLVISFNNLSFGLCLVVFSSRKAASNFLRACQAFVLSILVLVDFKIFMPILSLTFDMILYKKMYTHLSHLSQPTHFVSSY